MKYDRGMRHGPFFLFFLASIAAGQNEGLVERVDEALKQELDRVRREVLDLVYREIVGGGSQTGLLPRGENSTGRESLDDALKRITAADLRRHVNVLAGDDLEGRSVGYPGHDRAADYIAQEFKEIGLGPLGDEQDGARDYFQRFEVGQALKTRNVVGLLEGTDGGLKGEVVVLGAHYDHVGKAGQGNAGRCVSRSAQEGDVIWNGADDNASGTAALIEVARALKESHVALRRSVVFVAFSAEEMELKGSAYFVKEVPKPLARERIVAMVNLDMVGRNPDKPLSVFGTGTCERWEDWLKRADDGISVHYRTQRLVTNGSDYASFAARRIPAVHFFTGFHEDYHCQTDHADKIAYDRLEKIGRFALKLISLIVNEPERPSYPTMREFGVHIVTVSDQEARDLNLSKDQGGVTVRSVKAGGVAERAGLRHGDVIVAINAEKVPARNVADWLQRFIQNSSASREHSLSVIRDGKRIELKLRWEEEQ